MEKNEISELRAKPELENFTGKYEDNSFISRYLVNSYFKSVQKLINKTSDINLCHEIGAGEGWSTMRLKQMVPKLTASEFVLKQVKQAQINNPDLTIFEESVYSLKYKGQSIDLIFLLEVLEHLDIPELALKEIHRVTNKYLILGVPREPLWRFLNICRFKYLRDFGNTPGHLNHWSKRGIVDLIEHEFGKVIAVESPLPWTIVLAEKS
jgi:ubiquinone/menaquinone biosynthesis C-methylase UbiE